MDNDIKIRYDIIKLLQKYYVNYKPQQWNKFLKPKKSIEEDFYTIWKREHGGYINKSLLHKLSNDRYIPNMLPRDDGPITLYLPTAISNDSKFKQRYVRSANSLLLAMNPEHLILDLRGNTGGKSEVMVCALLPIFNMFKRKILAYIITRDGQYKKDIIKEDNCITSIINGGAKICGTKRKLTKLKKITIKFNIYTASAAEHLIITLIPLLSEIKIELRGDHTAGFTSTNKYYPLDNGGGIEIPYGYMTDSNKNIYYKGIKAK